MKLPNNHDEKDSYFKLLAKIFFKAIDMSTYNLFIAWFVLVIFMYLTLTGVTNEILPNPSK